MDSNWKDYRPEIWGGIECSCTRIHEEYRDQLRETGHDHRSADIQLIANLGISKLRYPILWERHQPNRAGIIDWTWASERLQLLKDYKIEVIAGLLHHGSGPMHTSLEDENFPGLFAAYARKVAMQFPHINYYNPVNEPLTTARFSGLYGFWYPHRMDEQSFFRMLLHQLKAIVLAMREIRKVNPSAQLVQTEDLTLIHSGEVLNYQADFENERRWLTYDFLCGKVDRHHPFWNYLLRCGISASALHFFVENPCVPDYMGVNYYVTSERYLDADVQRYPKALHGGNCKHAYADIEAVRAGKMKGISFLLKQAWNRYHLPLAVTECYLSCTREEQLRWINYCWESICKLNRQGVPVKALTVWSLFGNYDWNSLLTRRDNRYETGVFDTRGIQPRKTAMADITSSLAINGKYNHPLLNIPGWWLRKENYKTKPQTNQPTILIIGKHGTLANAFSKICVERAIPFQSASRQELNILNGNNIRLYIDRLKPWAIINTAGFVDVDLAEQNQQQCFALNVLGPVTLAKICEAAGIRFVSFSSDLVFNGDKRLPYDEEDRVGPINVYGTSKVDAEHLIIKNNPSALIIRSSAFFGPWDRANFVYKLIESVSKGQRFYAAEDVLISPTYVPDLVHAALDLLIDGESGVWHVANDGNLSWAQFGMLLARRAGYSEKNVGVLTSMDMGWIAKRPVFSVIKSKRGIQLPRLEQAIDRYFNERTV